MLKPQKQDAVELSAAERETLRCAAGLIIPASAEFAVPGADDPTIFADIERSLDRDAATVRKALGLIDEAAGGSLTALPDSGRMAALTRFRAANRELAAILGSVIARCYYRDNRVMISIGMEPRPPFPLGFEVEEGDWSILDPVRARGKIYRDADQGEVAQ